VTVNIEYCPLCPNPAGSNYCPAAHHYAAEDGTKGPTLCRCCDACRNRCSTDDMNERVRAEDKAFDVYKKESDV